MPLVHLKFREKPFELTEEQIEEHRLLGLLRDDTPAAAPNSPQPAPAAKTENKEQAK